MLVVDWKKEKPRDIVWAFNEHARELITGELALEMIQELKHLNPNRRITIIPVVNVWGRKRVEQGYTCQRKNKNGVDTNRNYPQKVKHHYALSSEEYEGKHPLSEPETKYISRILKGANKYINVHSGEYSLYMPWDSILSRPPHYELMKRTLKRLSKHCPQCTVGPAALRSFYKAYGSSVDYATTQGVEAYTFEIYGKETYDCTSMFNPDEKDMHKVLSQWKNIMSLTVR
jgi:predicted deacylase